MTEQDYKELTVEVKHSGMPLKSQKVIQRLIDKEYIRESCTGATQNLEREENDCAKRRT